MPSISCGPEEEEEEPSTERVVWVTSCALDGGSGGAADEVAEASDDEEVVAGPSEESFWRGKCVVFLEIDGILNTRPDPRMITVERVLCAQLRRLLDASKAEVVLTTRWRKYHEYISEVLTNFGALPDDRRELHRAPWNANSDRRDLEIMQWVNSHREIAGWVALDARDLMRFPSAPRMQGHTIQVNPVDGLTGDIVAAALRALGCSKDSAGAKQAAPSRPSAPAPSSSLTSTGASTMASKPGDRFSVQISAEDFHGGQTNAAARRAPVSQGTGGGPSVSISKEDFHGIASTAAASRAPASLSSMETDLASNLKSALSGWDDDLAGKMSDLLGSLPRAGAAESAPAIQFPRSDASRAEFEAVLAAARDKFKDEPAK